MAQDPEKTRVAGTGNVYVAAVGTAAPAEVDEALDAAFAELGYTSEDGATFRFAMTSSELKAWQSKTAIRKVVTDVVSEIEFELLQWEEQSLSLAFAGAAVVETSVGKKKLVIPESPTLPERALVLDIFDGVEPMRVHFAKATIEQTGDIVAKDDGLMGIPMKVSALGTGTGLGDFFWTEA